MQKQLTVSVVIPTYNGLRLLKSYLPSVFACLRAGDEVVIIDDASRDETVEWLIETYHLKAKDTSGDPLFDQWAGQVKVKHLNIPFLLIANQTNLRFGAAANRAVDLSTQPLVFLINNDVSPHPDVLKHLLPHFSDSKMFAVGCHEQEKNHGGISGGKNTLRFERGMFIHNRADNFETGETAWASGGSAVFDRAKWLELGGFSQAYLPAYWEDVDLSYRAKRRGWKVIFEKMAVVDHNHETTNANVFGLDHMKVISFKNSFTFVWRNGTWKEKLLNLWWLPYHLSLTNFRTGGALSKGFFEFLLDR